MFRTLTLSILLAAGTIAANAADQCDQTGKISTEYGVRQERTETVSLNHPQDEVSANELDPRYYRLKMTINWPDKNPWLLRLRDQSMRLLQSIDSHQFQPSNQIKVWSDILPGSKIYLDLTSSDGTTTGRVRVSVEEAIIMPNVANVPYHSWQGDQPNYGPLYQYEKFSNFEAIATVRRLGDYVGIAMSSGPNDQGNAANWCCSGLYVGKSLFLTNWHCGSAQHVEGKLKKDFWPQQICDDTIIDSAWNQDDAAEYSSVSGRGESRCSTVELADDVLDYALLRTEPLFSNRFSSMTLPPLKIGKADDKHLVIIQHPECRTKMVAAACGIAGAPIKNWRTETKTDLPHTCDTSGGSSGAPIFSEDGQLVAIHHLGFSVVSGQCDRKNKAIPIELIVDDIRAKRPDLIRELWLEVPPDE